MRSLCYKLLITGHFYPVNFFIHPKSIAFPPFSRLPTFTIKNGMFNQYECNHFLIL